MVRSSKFVVRGSLFPRNKFTLLFSKPDGDLPLLGRKMRFNRPTDPHVPTAPAPVNQGVAIVA
jgi:hypothetical protein